MASEGEQMNGRERKKRATRLALRAATLELGLARGLDEVSVDEIAHQAGVSTRTFFNYFDTKEDAALFELFQVSDAELDALATTGDPTGVWQRLTQLFLDDVERAAHDGPDLPRYMALHEKNPSVQARQQGRLVRFLNRLSAAVAARLGDQPDADLRAGLMAGSCITAVRVGLGQWGLAGWPGDARPYVAEAFAVFDRAFAPGS